MGNKQASGETLGSCQKTEISNGIVLLKPVDHQNLSALQISSKSVASMAEMYLKILRHPNILRYVDSQHEDAQLVIVVEKCSLMDLTRASDQEICYGLFSIFTLIEFLHKEVKLCGMDFEHIFTTSNGTWKIGLFHTARKITSVNEVLLDLQRLGELAVKAVGRCNLPHSEELEVLIRDLLGERQLDQKFISQLKSHSFFRDPFLETVTFLDNFLLKSQSERKSFFQGLDKKVAAIPEEVVAKLLTTKFLSRHVVLDETAQAIFLPKFLAPLNGEDPASEGFLSLRLFKDFVIPEIVRIFHVREVEVRLVFLKNFHRYFRYIEKPVLVEDILPEIMLGIRDTHDTLVAETLRVLSTLVDFLGAEVVLGGNRVKIFADGRPKSQRDEAIQLSIRERLNPISQEGPRSVPDNQFSRIEAKAEFLPERIPPEGGEDVMVTKTQLLFNKLELDESDEKCEDWTGWGGEREKKELDVMLHDTNLELNQNVKDEKQQYCSASDMQIQEENRLEVTFAEPKNKSTVDHVVDDEYEEWSGWDDKDLKIETKTRLEPALHEPEEDHSVNNEKDHWLSDSMLSFHGKNKNEHFSESETMPVSPLDKDTSDWPAWDRPVMDVKDENVLRNSGNILSEEGEPPRKPKVKALSLKTKKKDAIDKPSVSINTVNTPSQNQTSRRNGLSLSSKSFQEKSNSRKTNSSLGSEFDVMAIDLKIKEIDDPVDKLFEEFFGNVSNQAVPSRKHEIQEKVGSHYSEKVEMKSEADPGLEPVQKNIFAAVQVEEVGDSVEEGSGWDDF